MGDENLKNAVLALMDLLPVLATQFKDGVQMTDAAAIALAVQAEPLKSELAKAVSGIKQVQSEAKDLDAAEIAELVSVVALKVPALVKALKK